MFAAVLACVYVLFCVLSYIFIVPRGPRLVRRISASDLPAVMLICTACLKDDKEHTRKEYASACCNAHESSTGDGGTALGDDDSGSPLSR
jgi:hypothetical protein